jgi:hypothetical protein
LRCAAGGNELRVLGPEFGIPSAIWDVVAGEGRACSLPEVGGALDVLGCPEQKLVWGFGSRIWKM